jgi:5-hydroxyisourate hydrolase-like protein (transthyretin family)
MKHIFWVLVALALGASAAFAQVDPSRDPLSLFAPQAAYQLFDGKLGNLTAKVDSTYACVPADKTTEATLTVHLSDDTGSPVNGRMLAMLFVTGDGRLMPEQPVTDEKGNATFTYRAGRLAITNHIQLLDVTNGATSEVVLPTSLCAQVKVELIDPVAFARRQSAAMMRPDLFELSIKAYPEALPADGVSSSRLTAQLIFKNGKPAAGFPITFNVVSGDGSVSQEQKLTDASGYITAFYHVGETVGVARIEAVEMTTGKRASVEILVVEAGPAKLKLWLVDATGKCIEEKASMAADGASTLTVIAQVLSLVDTPIAGAKVQFVLKDNLGIMEVVDAVSNGNGEVRAIFTAGTVVGEEIITAYLVSE